jgi:hypothetical protein
MKPPRNRHAAPAHRQTRRPAGPRPRGMTMMSVIMALGLAGALGGAAFAYHSGKSLLHRKNLAVSLSSASAPMLGASVSSTGQLAQNTAEFGRMPIVRVYYKGLPAADAWTTGLPAASKSAVIVSFNAPPSAILSGADDAALSHFFDTAPRGHPIYYSYVHEPEHEIVHGEFTAAEYKAAWPHVVALANQAHNPDLHSTLILEEYDLKPGAHRDWRNYMPGGGIISTLGWDAYPATRTHRTPQPPSTFMAPAVAASKSAGLPFGFAEFGLPQPAGRAAWLSQVGSYLMNSGAIFGSLFDSANVQPSFKVTDPASISVWRGFVQASATAIASNDGGASSAPVPAPSSSPAPASRPSPSSPAPASAPSSSSPAPASPPSPSFPAVTGLALYPSRVSVSKTAPTDISFGLGQAADVTILVIARGGRVVDKLATPGEPSGQVVVPFPDAARHAGKYKILIVASNAHGSAIAERAFTVTRS